MTAYYEYVSKIRLGRSSPQPDSEAETANDVPQKLITKYIFQRIDQNADDLIDKQEFERFIDSLVVWRASSFSLNLFDFILFLEQSNNKINWLAWINLTMCIVLF